MCGPYTHSHWREINGEYEIHEDLERNAHCEQILVGDGWQRSGVDIVDGTACGNDGALLPDAVRTELELLFDMHFPDRNCIARFVRSHYGRRSDWAGWNDALWRLLSEAGWRQLPRSMLRERAHWCYWWERELARVGDRAGAEWGRRWAERLMSWLPTAPEYDHAWTLDDWLDLFERYPNAYWAKRDTPLAEEYEPVTRRRVPIK